ncbi:hypothetical protein H6A09_06700 [[Clostridium] spiroforme]|nr:hypothetical protein [Thomasclavelia spiroformis]
MAQGEIYVEVDASAINGGIAPMAIVSGEPEPVDGTAYVVVWIRWKYDNETGEGGYTGTGWYHDDPDNNIKKHYHNEEDFISWLKTNHPTNLDSVLSDWSAKNKAAFLNKHMTKLDAGGCLYFTANT